MEDDDFEDLLARADVFPGSSQHSLTHLAADLDLFSDMEESQETAQTSLADEDRSIDALCHEEDKRPLRQQVRPTTKVLGSTASNPTPADVKEQIERIFNTIRTALMSHHDRLILTINMRPTHSQGEARVRHISFPGRTADEAWRFSERAQEVNLWTIY